MISPLAYVSPEAKIGENVTVEPFAYIDKGVEIGDDCIIKAYASVLEGTKMGKNNKIYQHTVLGGEPQDFHYKGEMSELIIGDNNSIRENVVIARATYSGGATRIGNGNFLMDKVHICHDVAVHDECVIGIGAIIAGECEIHNHAILSSDVIVHQYSQIGRCSVVQSGCRITKDVPPYALMQGNPVAYHGVNTVIMKHFNTSEKILRHIANAYRIIYHGNFSIEDAVQKIVDQVPMSDEIQNIVDFVRASKRGITR